MRCLLPHLRKCNINAMQWFFTSTQNNILYLFTFCQGKLSINTYTAYQQIYYESFIHFSNVIVKLIRLAILVTVMLFGRFPWISSVFCSLLCIVCICGSWERVLVVIVCRHLLMKPYHWVCRSLSATLNCISMWFTEMSNLNIAFSIMLPYCSINWNTVNIYLMVCETVYALL